MKVGIIGLGYVGLPLAVAFCEAGHEAIGLDLDPRKVAAIEAGDSYIEDVTNDRLRAISDRFRATARYADLSKCDAVVIAVPTPMTTASHFDRSAKRAVARKRSEIAR